MLIKEKSSKKGLLILLLISIFLLTALPINKLFFKYMRLNIDDSIVSHDIGLSSIKQYSQHQSEGQTKTILIGLLKNFPNYINHYIKSFFVNNELSTLNIVIKFENLSVLKEDQSKARKFQILTNPRTVKGNIYYMGENIPVKIRLKGDLADHWGGNERYSLRISVANGKNIMGFNRFSIQKTKTRNFPYDYVYAKLNSKAGLTSPKQSFAKVTLNGTDWGIMSIEEHMSQQFLEKNKLKSSILLRLGSEEPWEYQSKLRLLGIPNHGVIKNYYAGEFSHTINLYGENKEFSQPIYRNYYSYIKKKIDNKKYTQLFNLKSLGQNFVNAMIWGDSHQLSGNNARYYFNPYDLTLHVIPTDAGPTGNIPDSFGFNNSKSRYIFHEIGKTSHFQNNFINYLENAKKQFKNIQEEINQAQILFPNDPKIKINSIEHNLKKISFNKRYVAEIIENMRVDNVQKDFPVLENFSNQTIRAMNNFVRVDHFDNGDILIYNLTSLPIKIHELNHRGKIIKINKILNKTKSIKNFSKIKIQTSIKGIQDFSISLKTSVNNIIKITKIGFTRTVHDLHNPLKFFEANKRNFISKVDGKYLIKSGTWIISSPLVINGDLKVLPNTKLLFSPNSYLIVEGKLTMMGTKDQPIYLGPNQKIDIKMNRYSNLGDKNNKFFKGLYVLNGIGKSKLQNVIIQNTTFLKDGILSLTGGVTFYNTDVELKDVKLLGSEAEDALNIVHSKFQLENILIKNCNSDAFDSDFSTGKISHSRFENIEGDALDFSGSKVKINKAFISNVSDKAYSVGENSIINLNGGKIEKANIALVSKDGSQFNVKDIVIKNSINYDAMSFTKKTFYESPTLIIENVRSSEAIKAVRQKGSFLKIDNNIIDEQELDIKKLYKSGGNIEK